MKILFSVKSILRRLPVVFAAIVLAFLVTINSAHASEERIKNYQVDLTLNQDSSIDIAETIDYDFGILQKHGIFRNIPYKYSARGGSFKLRISDISVRDELGSNINYSKSYSGGDLVLKIGDADVSVTGERTYVINYKVERAINYFSDYDELYFNAIGAEWTIPIEKAETNINFNQPLAESEIKYACYSGSYGSDLDCADQKLNKNSAGDVENISFNQSDLSAGEGMTVVVGTPKGYLHEPSAFEKFVGTLKDNLILLLPVFVFLIMIRLWAKRGRDPKARGAVVAEFDPPKGISTAEAGMIVRESIKNNDVSAMIIKLAVDGYLKIVKIEKKGILGGGDYQLERIGPGVPENSIESKLLEKIFDGSKTKKLSELKNKFFKDLAEIKSDVAKKVAADGFFAKNPTSVRATYVIIGGVVAGLAFLAAGFGFLYSISLGLAGAIIIVIGYFMPAKTVVGVEQKRYLLGLREYINIAEKDRIKFHNAPQKSPKHFEALLPFAMVFGLEREWGKQFEGIYTTQPGWYSDSGMAGFNSYLFASSLHDFNSVAATSLSSAPSSASGGGSGFSGGGAGGGFGGGGGGSW
ncbi:hypothetical protein A2215_02425 [Candidatus Berkelbacteria bacterium RIFOXYA2_FULL_43_10]|uniref:DUF2207 domain-containing protein n=1 Tax=Candidatus Berkelbacteria bacterium RIFOXYA2_FULL_43_10 TaxID=1797472 RepID=A0A1F5ECM2_9BACT|nr:MAG: hypothetical protein A2215_02425 [Candidatus Berkelbacteria bacterium RIFOXYA2_FULL_43_10]